MTQGQAPAGRVKALVLGAAGFVGRRVVEWLGPERAVVPVGPDGRRGFDARTDRLAALLPSLPADLTHVFILYGVSTPELCARDWAQTAALNVDSVMGVAEDCFRAGLTPVFFSTDYVFPGDRGLWRETDPLGATNAYGRQKAMVESWFADRSEPWLGLRLSKVVSTQMEPRNILAEWAAALPGAAPIRCAWDQSFSPLSVQDAAGAAVRLVEVGATGLFNLAGPEGFSRLGLLQLLVARTRALAPDRVAAPIEPHRLAEIGFTEPRPLDTSLDIGKLQRTIDWRFTPMAEVCDAVAAAALAAAPGGPSPSRP